VADAEAAIRRRSSRPTSRCSRLRGAPTARASRTYRWRTRSGRLRPVPRHRATAGARQFSRQQQRAAWAPDGRRLAVSADEGRRLAALPDQRRRHWRAAAAQLSGHRHRSLLHAGRKGAAVRLRPRRYAPDLRLNIATGVVERLTLRGWPQRVARATPDGKGLCSCVAKAVASWWRSRTTQRGRCKS